MGKENRSTLPPLRQDHLLTTRGFIRYCSDHGTHVDADGLETLHRLGLLVPLVKVNLGVVPHRRIYADFGGTGGTKEWRYVAADDLGKFKPEKALKQIYYTKGGLLMGGGDWLAWYRERGMVSYPAREKFKPWRHDEPTLPTFATKLRGLSGACELMYEKYQMLLLRKVAVALRVYGVGSAEKLGDAVRKLLRAEAKKLYAFIAFYIDAEAAYDRLLEVRENTLTEISGEFNGDKKEIQREWRGRLGGDLLRSLKLGATALLEQHGYSVERVRDWQHVLASSSVFGQARHSPDILRKYLAGLSEETLVLAEDTNYMIFILNTTIEWATGEKRTVREALGDWSSPRCSVCRQLFRKGRPGQVTCGSPVCAAAHKNELKRRNRGSGKYKRR